MYKLIFFALFLFIIGGWWYVYVYDQGISVREVFLGSNPVIDVGEVRIEVEVADTEEERVRGLSGRSGFNGDVEGLLFVFDEADYHGIWMKDMRFPIDVVWISEDLRVVHVIRHMIPESYPQVYEPEEPAKYILETESFFTDVYGIGVGDEVKLPADLTR